MTDVRQLPEAFLRKMQKLLGEEFGQYLESFKEEWKPGLRVNTLKLSPGELAELVPWNLEPVPWADNGFYYDGTLDGEVLRPSKQAEPGRRPYGPRPSGGQVHTGYDSGLERCYDSGHPFIRGYADPYIY